MITHIYHKIRFAILKRRIKKNHSLGKENVDGSYDYKQGSYDIRYRIIKQISGEESIEWISQRRRLTASEQGKRKIGKALFNFWHYQGWLIFFRPAIFFTLIISVFILYFGFVETQKTKVERFKWIVASAVGINPNQIQYIGRGWLEVSIERKKTVGIYEPVRYRFNPWYWFFSSEAGFVTRWRGEPFDYVTYPVVYNRGGEVWINKEGSWEHGKIHGKTVKWDRLIGSAKVAEDEISTEEQRLHIIDK